MSDSPLVTDAPPDAPRLRRTLSVWEAIGVSVALMAPSMAININPQGTAGLVGRAVPLAFALATAGVLLIAYSFVRLSQRFAHSGSVYGFVGATLGARTGAFSGWALVGTYTFYGMVTAMAAGNFVTDLVRSLGVWRTAPDSLGFAVGVLVLVVVGYASTRPARGSTRTLLVVEATTVALILLVTVVVLVRLVSGHTPGGQHFTLSVFTVPHGTGVSSLFLGVVFGFLSFAGFEASATLGEEAREPRRDIPRAILGTAVFGGAYFVVVTAVESMAFGTGPAGVKAFTGSLSLVGDLSSTYVAGWIGDVITIGATVSAVACCLACVVGASRLVFALSRDGLGPAPLAKVSTTSATPDRAAGAVLLLVLVAIALAWALGGSPSDLFLIAGTTGTLIILVAYVLASLGAMRLLFFSGTRTVPAWEVVVPVLGLVVLAYTLFRNVYPFPSGQGWWGPGLAVGWVVLVLVGVLARPAAARRAGARLGQAEGLGS